MGIPEPPSVLTISRWTHSYSLLQGKNTDESQSTEEAHRVESREVPNMGLPLSSPHGVRTHYFPGINMWQNTWSVARKGKSARPQCPEFLLGLHYIDMIDGFTAHVVVWPSITLNNIAGFSSVAGFTLRLSGYSQCPLCSIVLDYLVNQGPGK